MGLGKLNFNRRVTKWLFFSLCVLLVVLCVYVGLFKDRKIGEESIGHVALQLAPYLSEADIILREGVGADSLVIQQLGGHKYTHIGVVVSLNPIKILHATTNDNVAKQNQVILSSLEEFLAHAKSIAIKRYLLNATQKEQFISQLHTFLGKRFILNADSNRLYCTTLLEDSLKSLIPLQVAYTFVNIPILRGDYLFPRAFFEDNSSTLIYEVVIQ